MTLLAPNTDLWFLNTRVSIAVPASAGSDGLSVIHHHAPFGDSPPLHIHDTEDEVFHLLSGRIRFTMGDRIVSAQAGQTLIAPKGVAHSYFVDSPEGAQWMTVTTPGDFEALVREVARPATSAGLPAPHGPPSEAEAAALTEACARHGIRLVGAPMAPASAV
ncbi:cupin domain-containing protein [Actibacterium sp. XHP0104]|uniref:cupin domain-containing protein n=1 Tax=Actibacterium sp. XHP0104 TaxID=2984335 RepID=UPI0021E77145|nr:cupin domain-containing protein [Actibacterium sp. XHP0104]MCV2881779.1 cupin domain-containing protein [Actibacterium sp. XHP0104]